MRAPGRRMICAPGAARCAHCVTRVRTGGGIGRACVQGRPPNGRQQPRGLRARTNTLTARYVHRTDHEPSRADLTHVTEHTVGVVRLQQEAVTGTSLPPTPTAAHQTSWGRGAPDMQVRPGGPARVRAACVLSAEPLSVLVNLVSYNALTVSQRHVGPLSGLRDCR